MASMIIGFVICMVCGAAFVFVYRMGLRDGGREVKSLELPKITLPHREEIQSEETQSEFIKLNALLKNIDEYDGTSAGQREVI